MIRLLFFTAFAALFWGATTPGLKPIKKFRLQVPEPSDIAYSPYTNSYFIVSDQGMLYETDSTGAILRKSSYKGLDFEAVYADSANIYVSEEMTRDVIQFDIHTLQKSGIRQLHYFGGRNKGFESITYNQARNRFVVITEKNPSKIFELDNNFLVVNKEAVKKASDVSSATYYNDYLWLLSDEDHSIMQMNPQTYAVVKKYNLNIINPEGICFNAKGELIIISDDMQMMFNYGKIAL